MKKLNQKQKQTAIIAAAGVAAFALFGFGKREDKLIITGFDPETLFVYFNFNGKDYVRSVKSGAAMFGMAVSRDHIFRMRSADENGNVIFGLYDQSRTANLVKELAVINVSQYYSGPTYDPNKPLGTNER